MFKVIGFDLDQTLYPKSAEIDQAIQQYIYRQIDGYLGCGLEKAKQLFDNLYGQGLSGRRTLIKLGLPAERCQEIIYEAIEDADIDSFLVPNQENISLLTDLKNIYTLDLITGSRKQSAFEKTRKLGFSDDFFNQYITGEQASKSSGDAFAKWLSSYDFPPEQFLYIGDEEGRDYLSPKKFGIRSILVNVKKKNSKIECLQLSSVSELRKLLL